MNSLPVSLRFALRELRGGIAGFRIFLACLALGVGAIAGVGSVSNALLTSLQDDARDILGGDVDVRAIHIEIPPEVRSYLEDAGTVSRTAELRSMARVEDADSRSLVQLKAVDDSYPIAGQVVLRSGIPLSEALAPVDGVYGAVVEDRLLTRLGIEVGDAVRVGAATFEIRDVITQETDRAVNFASFGPRLMVDDESLPQTELIQPGSLITWHYRVVLPEGTDPGVFMTDLREAFPEGAFQIRGLSEAAPGLKRIIVNITQFLTLVGLTALLVGGVGVGNAVRSYVDGRMTTIATLRCVGATGPLVFQTYLTLVAVIAAAGIAIGLVIGAILPVILGGLLEDLFPVKVAFAIDGLSLGIAALFGFLTAFGFGIWPLAKAREVQPSSLFRDAIAPVSGLPRPVYIAATGAILLALAALAILSSTDQRLAVSFVGGSLVAFILFFAAAHGLMQLARRTKKPKRADLRLAIANLHRPGAATPSVAVSLGLGLTVLVAVGLVQANVARQVTERAPKEAPSYFFIDIQPQQKEGFLETVTAFDGVSDVNTTPMVRGRIARINGVPAAEATIAPDVTWTLNGDRGVTFSAAQPGNTTLVAGEWWPEDYSGPQLVSFDANIAAGYGIGIGDTITVNVLGREVTAEIASLRTIDWTSFQINFLMVFSPGILENAPHTVLATLQADGPETQTAVERAVTAEMPNVTAISVAEAVETANGILDNVGQAVQVVAGVAILAGTLVLAGAIAAGHRRRLYDAIILKVLGATRGNVVTAYAIEYGLLGLLIAIVAGFVGTGASYAVVTQVMRGDFAISWATLGWTTLVSTAITLILGLVGTWRALGQKPAPLLRNE
ncbi:MAG: ABC transporter permease [Alphaproteobacteria bacterium]|nr:ABC transporter permease [Alphaproteobacteria bacterium]